MIVDFNRENLQQMASIASVPAFSEIVDMKIAEEDALAGVAQEAGQTQSALAHFTTAKSFRDFKAVFFAASQELKNQPIDKPEEFRDDSV